MNTLNLLTPEEVVVGFDKRTDYGNASDSRKASKYKLGFVVYEEDGKLKKEKSWENWRDKKLKPLRHKNIPKSGFKLYGLDKRSSNWFGSGATMLRVMHPEGYVFEITVDNFLSLITHHNVINEEIMGELVLGWSGQSMSLISKDSHLYLKAQENKERYDSKVELSDLKRGDKIQLKKGEKGIFLGKLNFITTATVSGENGYKIDSAYCFINSQWGHVTMHKTLEVSYVLTPITTELTLSEAVKEANDKTYKGYWHSFSTLFLEEKVDLRKVITKKTLTLEEVKKRIKTSHWFYKEEGGKILRLSFNNLSDLLSGDGHVYEVPSIVHEKSRFGAGHDYTTGRHSKSLTFTTTPHSMFIWVLNINGKEYQL